MISQDCERPCLLRGQKDAGCYCNGIVRTGPPWKADPEEQWEEYRKVHGDGVQQT